MENGPLGILSGYQAPGTQDPAVRIPACSAVEGIRAHAAQACGPRIANLGWLVHAARIGTGSARGPTPTPPPRSPGGWPKPRSQRPTASLPIGPGRWRPQRTVLRRRSGTTHLPAAVLLEVVGRGRTRAFADLAHQLPHVASDPHPGGSATGSGGLGCGR